MLRLYVIYSLVALLPNLLVSFAFTALSA
jgi:hypothetical protein